MYRQFVIMLAFLAGAFGCAVKTSDALYADGIQLLREGKTDSAIAIFKSSLEQNQHNVEARYQLARAYQAEEKYALAAKEFQKVRLMNPYQKDIQQELAKLKIVALQAVQLNAEKVHVSQ